MYPFTFKLFRSLALVLGVLFSFFTATSANAGNLPQGCVLSSGTTIHTGVASGTLAGTTPDGDSAAGTYSSTQTGVGYNGVNISSGGSGLQLAYQNSTVGTPPDIASPTYTVTPNTNSNLGQIVVCQSPYENSGGNDEPSTWTLIWPGGGTALLANPGQVAAVIRAGIVSTDLTSPLTTGDALLFGNSIANGGSNARYPGPDTWALVIDMLGRSTATVVSLTKSGCLTPTTGPCAFNTDPESNVTGQTFQEWMAFDTIFADVKLGLVKTSSLNLGANSQADSGEIITYTYTVTNTGNENIFNVSVSEPDTVANPFSGSNGAPTPVYSSGGADLDSGLGTATDLIPGATVVFTSSYAISQADINAGGVTNSALATGEDISGSSITDSSDEADPATGNDDPTITNISQNSSMTVAKTATAIDSAGDNIINNANEIITYDIVVTNDGNTMQTNVVVNDALTSTVNAQCGTGALLPTESCTVTVSYTVSQSDLDTNGGGDGSIENTANASSTEITTNVQSNIVTTSVVHNPEFTMTKTSDTADIGVPGTITYTFTFINTGNVNLTALTVADSNIDTGTLNNCPINNLSIGDTAMCTATRTITRVHIREGNDLTNTAIPSAKGPDGITPATEDDTSNDNSTITTVTTSADLSVVKTLLTPGTYTSGQTITYEIVVTNSTSSWSDATDVVVTDLPTNLTITNVSSTNCSALPCTIPLLLIGDSETITVQATAP